MTAACEAARRPVPGFPGYEASEAGEIYSLARVTPDGRRIKGRVLKQWIGRKDYPHVNLYRDGKKFTFTVYRLMALTFLGPRPDGMEVRHMNGVRTMSAIRNLEYGTRSENMRDKRAHGTDYFASRTHCKNSHEFTPENTSFRGGTRLCRACTANRQSAYRKRRAAFKNRKTTKESS